mmetsp:Transcript_11284/g.30778  ORF Transcript_11284/g.30778 Transcript_11284/m.30778 type:complete len:244 (+) Transcript_11284:93-824(+)|eukprot:CAMPEP_0202379506 /NCGR_PEP_ID=MMETSP1127-20130417/24397_1 /ASSEMBLY_ACC=CAM_ASM_000462 /TAXON_ID=3047 /ORGANISM="Dunaliella tertiolecta, Strain CCMP1320" /LENGTH=243 /DNA_ID=CAMNT_0048978027 /DNA_START=72 /DNA_END=803 /DNA_ORIENTATION=+
MLHLSSPSTPSAALHARQQRRTQGRAHASSLQASKDIQGLKAEIRKAVQGTARGRAATPTQRQQINQLVMELEKCNPKPVDPALSVNGWWALLYQASLKEEPGKAPDKSTTLEGPFLATFQPLTKNIVRTRNNTQLLDLDGGRAENVSNFTAFGIDGSLNIMGSAELMEPHNSSGATRIFVEFKEFVLDWAALKLRVPLSWVRPTGWVETTYIDDAGWRVGRGDKGSIFVTSRILNKDSARES